MQKNIKIHKFIKEFYLNNKKVCNFEKIFKIYAIFIKLLSFKFFFSENIYTIILKIQNWKLLVLKKLNVLKIQI